jgi:hypothetical protein
MILSFFLWLPVCIWLSGCTPSGNDGDGGCDEDALADPVECEDKGPLPHDHGMQTPILGPCHTGWKKQHCGVCHLLPVRNHLIDRVPECAGCHGGNGACDNSQTSREHKMSDDCVSCHMEKHSYTDNDDCTYCHFATDGVVDCPCP